MSSRFVPLALVTVLVALLPLSMLAADPFTDLNAGSPHNANIHAITDAGITKGCDPGVDFCPNGLVTREEMASFLARTAGLGDNPLVANARTAQTVPDRSVTAAKLNPHGATARQVLTATSDGVAWQTVAGGNGTQGPAGPQGSPGPQGVQGSPGPQGVPGPTFASDARILPGTAVIAPPGEETFVIALCSDGAVAMGGGHYTSGVTNETHVIPLLSLPYAGQDDGKPRGWLVKVYNAGTGNVTLNAFVICLPVASPTP